MKKLCSEREAPFRRCSCAGPNFSDLQTNSVGLPRFPKLTILNLRLSNFRNNVLELGLCNCSNHDHEPFKETESYTDVGLNVVTVETKFNEMF